MFVRGANRFAGGVKWAYQNAKKIQTDKVVTNIREGLYHIHTDADDGKDTTDVQPFFHRLAQGLNIESWDENKCTLPNDLASSRKPDQSVSRSIVPETTQLLIRLADGLELEDDGGGFTFGTPGWASEPTSLTFRKDDGKHWRVTNCVGRHCSDMIEGVQMLSLRVQVIGPHADDHAHITSICNSASMVLDSIRDLKHAGFADCKRKYLRSEQSYLDAAKILERNAEAMEYNAKIIDDEYALPKEIYWGELADLLSQERVDLVSDDPSQTKDDPFEKKKRTMDDYVQSRYTSGQRNKLAMFLRRRAWELARSRDTNKMVFLQHGEVATASQLRNLAFALRHPRNGAVVSTGIALHSLAVDILSGVSQKVYYKAADLWSAAKGSKDAPDDNLMTLIRQLHESHVKGACNLALVSIDYLPIPNL
eukprot:TRINITY_DN7308_c0_g1_i1.p1 TRINITY_DN7308_c0_g1~~TRINITY_DN7308_c0_g1_i1.p1  ORF type:complete len:422 (+),score=49.12 TRINITY_DN7308_c0_g1_i1:137-1402(+)